MLRNELKYKVSFEIGEIESLLRTYESLLNTIEYKKPDIVEMSALAMMLQAFYNAMEKIFLTIARDVDMTIPRGSKFSRDLLVQMAKNNNYRVNVLTVSTAELLYEYMAFRYFCQRSYSFNLKWEKIDRLCLQFKDNWNMIRRELSNFVK